MGKGKRKVNPRLPPSTLYKEIGARAGIPADVARLAVESYADIVMQCLQNKVEVMFGNVGTFKPRVMPPRDHTEWYGFIGNSGTAVYYCDNVDGYIKPLWAFRKSFLQKLKENSIIPYGSVPSGESVYDTRTPPEVPRINYAEVLEAKRNKSKQKEEEDEYDSEYDEYEDVILEDEENNSEVENAQR